MKEKKRKVGRPKLPKGQVRSVLAIRLTAPEREELEAAAKKNDSTVSEFGRKHMLSHRIYEEIRENLIRIRGLISDCEIDGQRFGRDEMRAIYDLADRGILALDDLGIALWIEERDSTK